MKKLITLIFALIVISCTKDIPNTIKFSTSKGVPTIKAKLNGIDGTFLIDTGASISIIDSSLVHEYGFKLIKFTNGTVNGIGGSVGLYETTNAKLFYNDTAMYVNFKASNLTHVRETLNIVGIIGTDYFQQNNIIIDYENNVLRKPIISN